MSCETPSCHLPALPFTSGSTMPQAPLSPEDSLSYEAEAPTRRLNHDDLRAPFLAAAKAPDAFLVGTEAEKFGVRLVNGRVEPVQFGGACGVGEVLAAMAQRFGFEPHRETHDGAVIALLREHQSITLEPAAQLELSGAPLRTVHETAAEFDRHFEELRAVSEQLGIFWLSLGFHPFARQEELPHVPKLRYGVMEQYLPTRGRRSLDMMRRTCTVQANLDYENLDDAMRKLRIALALQPVFTAMFANSPWFEGQRGAFLSERADVWLHMDPDRSGLLPFAWDGNAGLDQYIDWALSAPMFLVRRGSKTIKNTGQSFRDFMAHGYGDAFAELGDWETHLNTLFPEVRLKKTLEVRGADAQSRERLCAVPALWKGLLYDADALLAAERLIGGLDYHAVQTARPEMTRVGLKAPLAGRTFQGWAEDMLDIATASLDRQARASGAERSEAEYLAPMRALLQRGQTPAEALLEQLGPEPTPEQIVAASCI